MINNVTEQSILEKNITAMDKWYPKFTKLLKEKYAETDDNTEVAVEESFDGKTIFCIEKDGRRLYLGGRRNAAEPVKLWIDRMGEFNDSAVVFLYGIGSGAYLKALIDSTSEKVTVVVYEPSLRIFMAAMENIDLSAQIANRAIAFIVEGVNESEFEPVMQKVLNIENLEFVREEIHPNYREFYGEKIAQYVRILQRYVEGFLVNYNTGRKLSVALAVNLICNMKYICDGYNTRRLFEAVPYDIPAILVSAGPSLNKNISMLAKAKNKAFILAVDTAVKPLLKAGIVPDAYATIDAVKNRAVFDMDAINDIPIIAPTTALTDIVEKNRAKKIFYYDGYVLPYIAYMAAGKSLPDINIGQSVACCAFSILYKMNFDTIILVGQDLAYTGGKSHADGTFKDIMPEENTENFIMVKGNYEDKVPTQTSLRIFLEWFEKEIELYSGYKKLRVVNATEGGAYIKGTELMTLENAINLFCDREVDIKACIDGMKSEFNEEERKRAVEYIHTIPGEFADIEKAAKQLHSVYKKLGNFSKSGANDKEAALKLLKRIKKLNNQVHKKDAYQLVEMSMPVADYVLRSEYFYDSAKKIDDELARIAGQGLLYSELLQECAGILRECAQENLMDIK